MLKKFTASLLGAALLAPAIMAPSVSAQGMDFSKVEIKTEDLGNGIYVLFGMGGNIGVSVGEEGVFVIDDQFAPLTPKISAAIKALTDKPVDYVINTHWHGDHTGGNEAMGKMGARIVAHDNVRVRILGDAKSQERGMAPPVITFSDTATFYYNGHEIHAYHPVNAHTDGDAIIHFKNLNIIHAGDVLFNGRYPFIDVNSGGSVDGYISALEKLYTIANDETVIIAGHGPVAKKSDIKVKIDMLKDAKMMITAMIKDGKSLDEVQAANPLGKYDEKWTWGFINTARMTEMLYGALQP